MTVTLCRKRADVQGATIKMVPSLASYLVTTVEMLWTAYVNGHQGYVLWDEANSPMLYYDEKTASSNPNMWEWYFEQPYPVKRAEVTWQYIDENYRTLARQQSHLSIPGSFIRDVLRFKPEIKTKAEQLTYEHNLIDHTYVAVAHRGTDRIHDGGHIVQIENYFSTLDRLENNRMLILPEERTVLDTLLARYENAIHIAHFYCVNAGESHMCDWTNPKTKYERGRDAALMFYLFAHAQVLVYNKANLATLAARYSEAESWEILKDGSASQPRTWLWSV